MRATTLNNLGRAFPTVLPSLLLPRRADRLLVLVIALAAGNVLGQGNMQERVNYGGWPNCVRLSNDKMELIVTTDVGPRVIRTGFIGGQNLFKEAPEDMGKTGGDTWRGYGGHRLWHAPEAMPRTYFPDNGPVKYSWNGKTLKLVQAVETTTGMAKEIEITLAPAENKVTLVHRITNKGLWDVELSPWCLTVMAPGGRAIFPQEPFRPHPDYLLPARPVVLWHYTDMKDPRWIWGTQYIQLRQDPGRAIKQKVGLLNKQGWTAYYLKGDLFIKRFGFDPQGQYPDYGCNNEAFTNADMLEVETLGPLAKVAPEGSVEHTETWILARATVDESEGSIDRNVLPLVK